MFKKRNYGNLLLFTLFVFVLNYLIANSGGIRGHVQYPVSAQKLPQPGISLVGLHKWQSADSTGTFAFDSLADGSYFVEFNSTFDFYGTIFRKVNVSGDSVVELNIEFPEHCLPNTDSICPVCGKYDKVIHLMYGKPTGELMDEAEEGKVKLAGCLKSFCAPLWYCKRDSLEF